jgi:hypothetical protein
VEYERTEGESMSIQRENEHTEGDEHTERWSMSGQRGNEHTEGE